MAKAKVTAKVAKKAVKNERIPPRIEFTPKLLKQAANMVGAGANFESHRGAMVTQGWPMTVIYGNDGYESDVRTKKQVELCCERLREMGLQVSGFATCDGGYSWVLAVSPWKKKLPSLRVLNRLIWDCWATVRGLTIAK